MDYYVDVIVCGVRGSGALSYHHHAPLSTGQIVKVPLRDGSAFGVVSRARRKAPDFPTKPLTAVPDLPPLPPYTLETIEWMTNYYGAHAADALRLFLPDRPDIISSQPDSPMPATKPTHSLTPAQKDIVSQITRGSEHRWLLHGVTGSGKTAVYIDLVRRLFKQGRSSIVLVPEITLATQMIETFRQALGDRVIITHSNLTAKQRRDAWHRALNASEPVVIIGPRSALFTPLQNLGMVVIDECHEPSYKQEQPPHYHAREAARFITERTGSKLVLGSATPAARDIYEHREKSLELVSLPEPIHRNRRQVDIIDMRSQKSIISPQLHAALGETLSSGKQALLFINRRGSASQVLCSGCGYVARCKDCDIPQTWHGDSGLLRCHFCGTTAKLPGTCPECHGMNWRFLGIGTKRIESLLQSEFPQARTLRLDKDSFSGATIAESLRQLQSGDIDVLIGTQMVAKGLDIPGVTLVGVVLADTMLHIPDMSSNERTYQLLHQVIGRSGRSHDASSRVLIQTYNPSHHAITTAARHDFHSFMDTELNDRRELNYPPYAHLLKLTAKRKTAAGARATGAKLAGRIRAAHSDVSVRGPAPAWRERIGQHFYWQLILTASRRQTLLDIMNELPANWQADIDPVDLL